MAERVQPLAPHQPGWKYGWRADAEVSHSELDRSLPWKRMPYYKPVNQDLFMYAHVMLNNERAWGEYVMRQHDEAA